MADPVKPPPLPLAADGGVKAYDRLGGKISVPADKVDELVKMGGRVATPAEDAAERTQEAYDKQSLGTKVATVASLAGPVAYPLHAYMRSQGAVLPPELEAYTQGVSKGFTGGAASVGMKELTGAIGGDKAAHAYGQTAQDVSEAHPTIHGAGEIAGFVGGASAGGAGLGGAGKVIPGVGISALGGVAEQGAARALAPIAARGAIGRALATGGEFAARGAVEGALYGGANQITEDMLGDRELVADKVFASMGTGALYGGAGGAVLGGAGSLAASGTRGLIGAGRSALGKALATTPKVGTLEAVAKQAGSELEGAAGDAAAQANYAARKAATEGENAVRGVADDALTSAKGIAEATGTDVAQETNSLRAMIDKAKTPAAQKGAAYDQAWKAIGAGNGLQSTAFAKRADRYLVNGTDDVGEWILRKKIINPEDGAISAMRHGTPEAMLPKIEAEVAITGQKLGDMTAASPARIRAADIERAINEVAGPLEKDAATEQVGEVIRKFGDRLKRSMGIAEATAADLRIPAGGKISIDPSAGLKGALKTEPAFAIGEGARDVGLRPSAFASSRTGASEVSARRPISMKSLGLDPDAGLKPSAMKAGEEASDIFRLGKAHDAPVSLLEGEAGALGGTSPIKVQGDVSVSLQELLRQRKAIDNMVFDGVALDPAMSVQVKRELRGKLEGLIEDALDAAGGKLPGEQKAAYKALKRDYTAGNIALDAAEDSAARMAKGATFGLTDTLRGGGSLIKTVGSKIIRERGNAAAAVLLYRMADMGTLTSALTAVDEQVGKAAKGLLAAPVKRPLPEAASTEPLRARAARIMDRAAEAQANPEGLASAIAGHTEPLTANTPNLAVGLGQRMTSAYALLVSKIPVHADPDPFDPHPAARLSDAQAAEVVRYGAYTERPMRFFEEAEHGKLTYEGVEVAKVLMPGMFAELQQRTVENLADMMARGQKPPFAQRERIGMLLDIPATPSQRPEHMMLLQQNLLSSGKPQTASSTAPNGASAPKRPLATKSQPSTLDRLEGR